MNIGMETRVRYEVSLFGMRRGFEDLKDWMDATNYKDAVKKAKEQSMKEGITHTEVVKNIEFFYPEHPDDVIDIHVEKRWLFVNGKQTGMTDY